MHWSGKREWMMSNKARNSILNRLRVALGETAAVEAPLPEIPPSLDPEENIIRLTEMMAAEYSEVYRVKRGDWLAKLAEVIQTKKIDTLLYGPWTCLATELETMVDKGGGSGGVQIRPYVDNIEIFKKELFGIDAGITTTMGAIADRGALILWPTQQEPRSISLVPPIHIAVLDADKIYSSLSEAIKLQKWADGMPTNALLISGPSKTADIEFTMVCGVHGPKKLIVIIREG
jgi:L-lactate dehydrogenase complex protein LldG